jgi:hypothetical protein
MDDHAPKDTCAQYSNDQQSQSLQDCIWLVRFCQMDNKRPIMKTINFKGGYVWQSWACNKYRQLCQFR